LPRIWARRRAPSKHWASRRPFPSILTTWAYSWPSSLKTSSRFSLSFSFLPLRRFLPPWDVLVYYRKTPSIAPHMAGRERVLPPRGEVWASSQCEMWRGAVAPPKGVFTYLSLVLRHVERLSRVAFVLVEEWAVVLVGASQGASLYVVEARLFALWIPTLCGSL
jgi:hypothetical protein